MTKKKVENKLDKRNKMCLDAKIIESLFLDDEFFSHVSSYKKISSGRYPKTDQWCDEKGFNLAFALAGFSVDDIEVYHEDRTLWVCTKKKDGGECPESGFIHRGIAKRSFKKGYFLDFGLDLEKVSSKMKDGLLTINIPFTERVLEKRKVEIDYE